MSEISAAENQTYPDLIPAAKDEQGVPIFPPELLNSYPDWSEEYILELGNKDGQKQWYYKRRTAEEMKEIERWQN
jgi:hypothetical protein